MLRPVIRACVRTGFAVWLPLGALASVGECVTREGAGVRGQARERRGPGRRLSQRQETSPLALSPSLPPSLSLSRSLLRVSLALGSGAPPCDGRLLSSWRRPPPFRNCNGCKRPGARAREGRRRQKRGRSSSGSGSIKALEPGAKLVRNRRDFFFYSYSDAPRLEWLF